jgi:hypothetical protein
MNIEKFKLWNLALSTIHIDGVVSSEEEEWFDKTITDLDISKRLDFSDEQIHELKKTFDTPSENFEDDFKKLLNPSDCSFLVHILRVVSHLDKNFSEKERALYKRLEQACLEGVDLDEIEAQVKSIGEQSRRNEERKQPDNPHSMFESIFKTALSILS